MRTVLQCEALIQRGQSFIRLNDMWASVYARSPNGYLPSAIICEVQKKARDEGIVNLARQTHGKDNLGYCIWINLKKLLKISPLGKNVKIIIDVFCLDRSCFAEDIMSHQLSCNCQSKAEKERIAVHLICVYTTDYKNYLRDAKEYPVWMHSAMFGAWHFRVADLKNWTYNAHMNWLLINTARYCTWNIDLTTEVPWRVSVCLVGWMVCVAHCGIGTRAGTSLYAVIRIGTASVVVAAAAASPSTRC